MGFNIEIFEKKNIYTEKRRNIKLNLDYTEDGEIELNAVDDLGYTVETFLRFTSNGIYMIKGVKHALEEKGYNTDCLTFTTGGDLIIR
jgi:GTP cyclohydrolase III